MDVAMMTGGHDHRATACMEGSSANSNECRNVLLKAPNPLQKGVFPPQFRLKPGGRRFGGRRGRGAGAGTGAGGAANRSFPTEEIRLGGWHRLLLDAPRNGVQ